MASQTPDLQAVAERLGKVEKQNRRLKSVGIAVLLLVSAVLVIGQAVPKEPILLEAEAFILRDKNGNVRAGLMLNEDGSPSLTFLDKNENLRAWLVLDEDGMPSFMLFDENENKRAVLGFTSLEVTKTGEVRNLPPSSLVLFNKEGKVLFKAP